MEGFKDNFATQYDGQGAGGAGAGAPPQQDPAMGGQMPDNSQGHFQGGAGGDPGSAGVFSFPFFF